MSDNPYRQVPSVNEILYQAAIQALQLEHAHDSLVAMVRAELDDLREQVKTGGVLEKSTAVSSVVGRIIARAKLSNVARLRRVINATGIVLHTNLGRSPMATDAVKAATEAASGYLNLELDLATGQRSSRQDPIREILTELTGAESATAVNNCAAATVITLRALASGREVIVSRGQLIEIGGSFRIPEIMSVSGAILREVGTTNITRLHDYERAIGPNTGALMRIHPSNYRIRGFTEEATLDELVDLSRRSGIPVIDDVGSGAMLDFAEFGLPGEPIVSQSIAAGADLVLCSGDKLLGGPQAGLIAGRKEYVARIEKDPLMRAFRLDKMTLAALEATLRLYRHPERALRDIPTLRMLSLPKEAIHARALALAGSLELIHEFAHVRVLDDCAYVGGGSLPDLPLPTSVVAVQPKTLSDSTFAERLRLGRPSALARIHNGQILFDLRTVFVEQDAELIEAIRNVSSPTS